MKAPAQAPVSPLRAKAEKAMARFLRTDDGRDVGLFILGELQAVPALGTETCALHEHNGRRRFALEILNMKDADLKPDGGRDRKDRRRYKPAADAESRG